MCEIVEKEEIKLDERFIVIVDGDGAAMGHNYYRRRRELGLGVRNNGDEEREAIVVEGVVITRSESLARQMYMLAEATIRGVKEKNHDRNPTVSFGQIYLRPFVEKPPDRELWNALEAFFSRRGRKPKGKRWSVYCEECFLNWDEESIQPVSCPECGGLAINWEMDGQNRVQNFDRGPV